MNKTSSTPPRQMSVRGRVFLTMILLVMMIELISGLIFHRHLSEWLFDHTVEQSARACRSLARQLRTSSSLKGEGPQSTQDAGTLSNLVEREQQWLNHVSETLGSRLSVFNQNKVLIFDSVIPRDRLKSNVGSVREELQKTREDIIGVARRRSTALEKDLIFVSCSLQTLNSEPLGYIRLAKSASELDQQLNYLDRVLLYIFGITLAFTLLISGWVARMLSQTLHRLVMLAKELASGRGNTKLEFDGNTGPDEYSKLARSLSVLATQIEDHVGRLAESRDRFEAVLDSMREGVIALDEDYRISLANISACKLLGWSYAPLDQQINDCVTEESLMHFLREQIAEEAPWVELEFKHRRIVLARLTPLSARGDAVLVLNDITALRRLETVRRDFVANVSHELRTPTTVIQANAETLIDGAMEEPELAKTFLDGINRNAQRLSHLVSDLLDLSRIESGTYKMTPEVVQPYQVIKSVVDTLADQIVKKQVKVKIEIDESLEIYQDVGALEQVFTNLIENAVNYSDERGCVRIRSISSIEKQIRFEVLDDGPGISAKHVSRIFERFYRVDKGRSRQLGGTGLGLAIVKHLCQEMGGEVGLESKEGEGCTFWFDVPLGH